MAMWSDKQKSRCDIKFVKWLVRKNRDLSMSKNDDELNEFIDEVTDGTYNLSCVEVILKLVNQMQPWGDERMRVSCVKFRNFTGQSPKLAHVIW